MRNNKRPAAVAKFTIKSVRKNNEMIHHITWPVTPLNADVYSRAVAMFRASRDYSKMSSATRKRFTEVVNGINAEASQSLLTPSLPASSHTHTPTHTPTHVDPDQLLAIRNVVVKDKIIKNYGRMNHVIPSVARKYSQGVDIVKLSYDYDFPPMNLLRGIFLHLNMDSAKVYAVFANKTDPAELLDGRNLDQYWLAEQNDAESTFNQQMEAKIAEDNENMFVNHFKRAGIALTTQAKLVAEQMRTHGRAVATPDLLFEDKVFINGEPIKWIDFKNYIGTDIRFLHRSNLEQVARYEIYGRGALCFRRGFVEGLQVASAMLLDTSALGLRFK